MTKKKSHLRRKPRHLKQVKPRSFNPLLSGSVVEDRVKIIVDRSDRTLDYSMPRREAELLVEQGKLAVSGLGGYEATDKYPRGEQLGVQVKNWRR